MEVVLTSPWRKSRASNPNGACAEVGSAPGAVLVRDTKQAHLPDGQRGMLAFSPAAWDKFTAGLK